MFNKLLKLQYIFYQKRWRFLSSLINKWVRIRYNCDIPYSINFENIHLCHEGFGIVINPNTQIGRGTYIQHGVTIGAMDDKNEIKAPKIGCNCYIGAKAIILGGIIIGDNVKIGAGAVVISDIPDGATAVGVPAKVI